MKSRNLIHLIMRIHLKMYSSNTFLIIQKSAAYLLGTKKVGFKHPCEYKGLNSLEEISFANGDGTTTTTTTREPLTKTTRVRNW